MVAPLIVAGARTVAGRAAAQGTVAGAEGRAAATAGERVAGVQPQAEPEVLVARRKSGAFPQPGGRSGGRDDVQAPQEEPEVRAAREQVRPQEEPEVREARRKRGAFPQPEGARMLSRGQDADSLRNGRGQPLMGKGMPQSAPERAYDQQVAIQRKNLRLQQLLKPRSNSKSKGNTKVKHRVGNIAALLMILMAVIADGLGFVIQLIPVVGQILGMLLGFLTQCAYALWFFFLGVNYFLGKRAFVKVAAAISTTLIEIIPFISALPALTLGVLVMIWASRSEDKEAEKSGKSLSHGVKDIGKTVAG